MQLMKQFSVNEAKYSFVLETKALGETDQLTVLGKWCHTEFRAGSQKRKWSSGPGPAETETENTLKHHNCTQTVGSLLQIKSRASGRKKRGTLATTKKLNHSSCRAQHEPVALGEQSCTEMKWYKWKKFRDTGRNCNDMTSNVM